MKRLRRTLVHTLAVSLACSGLLAPAQAGWVSTPQLVAATAAPLGEAQAGARERLGGLLERSDVAAALQARGVAADAARERVAALSDAEAAQLLAQIDSAPAGGDVLGTVVFIFVLLLVTDILGFTKVFPFTRSIR